MSYLPTCMGYNNSSYPRRKWRCYFCKVIKYGLKANLVKLAPNESQYCKILLSGKMHWKETASHLLNILKEYPASKAFWYSEKRENKEYKAKDTYSINLKKISRHIDHDLNLISLGDNETEPKYDNLETFLKDLLTVFRNIQLFVEPGKRKYRYSQACYKFVNFLLEKEKIFTQNQRHVSPHGGISYGQDPNDMNKSESSKSEIKVICQAEDSHTPHDDFDLNDDHNSDDGALPIFAGGNSNSNINHRNSLDDSYANNNEESGLIKFQLDDQGELDLEAREQQLFENLSDDE